MFDSKVTTGAGLADLHAQGLRFLTLRQRSPKVIARLEALPDEDWTTITLERKGRHRRPQIHCFSLLAMVVESSQSTGCAGKWPVRAATRYGIWSTRGMSRPGRPLNVRQLQVLQWLGDRCPDRAWPHETYKASARALESRGLASVTRKNKVWTASITEVGRYYLKYGRYPPVATQGTEREPSNEPTPHGGEPEVDQPPPDVTARAMLRVARRKRPTTVVHTQGEIREPFMRYKVVVTRVQVAERFVRAPSEEAAAGKIQEEFERPYGYFGSWKTTHSEIDVIEAEETTVIGPTHLSADGPLLLSIKDAAKALGISYSTLYQMLNQGDIEFVVIGRRKYIARDKLLEFIERNTHKGYYVAR